MTAESESPSGLPDPAHPPTSIAASAAQPRRNGRCHACGYSLVGLPGEGVCPECGSHYDYKTAMRLKPWPSPLAICLRLGWPIAGLCVGGAMLTGNDMLAIYGATLMWAMIVALAINSWLQVRLLLKRSLPERVRTKGPVAILRAVGIVVCVVLLLGFVVAPIVFAVGCLMMIR